MASEPTRINAKSPAKAEAGNAEFDRYANAYTDLVRTGIRASGEEPSYFAAMKARYMADLLGDHTCNSPLDVLDFGCGIGNSIPHLREAFPASRLHGVDPSGESTRLASAAHADATFSTNTDEALPYADGSFDVVQVACVFHHIRPSDRLNWMREIHRVLKPGGHIFVFEHNVLNPVTVKAVRESPVDQDAVLLPRHELLRLVRGSSFRQIGSQYTVFFPRLLALLRPLEPVMGWIPFGAQYVVHAVA
jgi:SAM-dependent methyltransferase